MFFQCFEDSVNKKTIEFCPLKQFSIVIYNYLIADSKWYGLAIDIKKHDRTVMPTFIETIIARYETLCKAETSAYILPMSGQTNSVGRHTSTWNMVCTATI